MAADAAPTRRDQINERLRSEFRYQAVPADAASTPDAGDVEVEMPVFLVTEPKDRSGQVGQFFREERQRALDQKPSLERGAAIHGERAIIGPQPYRDLFKDDARFKEDKAITPTWNLFDLKL